LDLILNTRGTYLHQKNEIFEIEVNGQKQRLSPQKVKSIIISTSIALSSDVIMLAVKNNIDIVMLNEFGDPYGRFWHSKFGSTAYIRRRQIEAMESAEGLLLAKHWIINKIEHSSHHLKTLAEKRPSKADKINKVIDELNTNIEKLKKIRGSVQDKRFNIMAIEGDSAQKYFSTISFLIPEPYKFNGRSSRPAKDEYNCMLNYAFGVLYGKVEKACIIAGLDPYVGILHTDNYNKKSLVFDLIENYRHLAWKVVFKLFSTKRIKQSYFDKIKGGFTLNTEGKKALLGDLEDELNKKIKHKNKHRTNLDVIQLDCHHLANALIEKE
jgi:CRISPR-associated protein Cas1